MFSRIVHFLPPISFELRANRHTPYQEIRYYDRHRFLDEGDRDEIVPNIEEGARKISRTRSISIGLNICTRHQRVR